MYKSLVITIFISILLSSAYSQKTNDTVINSEIHTVLIYKSGTELNLPVIELNSEDKLEVSFDDLNPSSKNYNYKIIHCNSEWEPENISFTDFMDGYEVNYIRNRSNSTTTSIPYHHYSFNLPDENVSLRISGNFLLIVFEENDESKIAFQKRFYVFEKMTLIDFKQLKPIIPKYSQRNQQIKLKVQVLENNIADIKNEIVAKVRQNFDPLSEKKLYPNYTDGTVLTYDDNDSCIFYGSNEFRNFDIKSIKYQSPRIKTMGFENGIFNFYLIDDEFRIRRPYLSDIDINGRQYIENSQGRNKNIDADYIKVHFSLPTTFIPDGNLFIYGALTNWTLGEFSKMDYNFNNNAYEKTLLLKQGYYNYLYIYKNEEFSIIDNGFVESNHFETENEYQVFVYFKDPLSRYDRLIGFYATPNQNIKLK